MLFTLPFVSIDRRWLFYSAAGKSHLALQFCLRAQLPLDEGGISASSAFLSSESAFPSSRLLQMAESCSSKYLGTNSAIALDNVHLATCESLEDLEHTVSFVVPALVVSLRSTSRNLRVLVIDSIAAPIRSDYASSSTNNNLLQRGKDLSSFGQKRQPTLSCHHANQ